MEKVLLHCCCAPCSAPIMEWMLNNNISPTLFYFNPNIFPSEEYLKRKEECIAYAQAQGIDFIDGDYNHADWLAKVAGLEDQPERGTRCLECFKIRLKATAILATEKGFSLFTTTLAGSRWKSFTQIVEAGNWAASLVTGVQFWEKDWKKGGLTERRKILLQENQFYNQQYCGCEFSIRGGK
ncbi:epoxyqueuosine reductase QueH [Bacteroides sp. 224]|uniref:epoxyqueuosine reductase QueH n=1 Tax=Bacteroides sp. 224 TaxID=2302936 RepID=UPI0013D528D2|nr:epoxyqueuosine reductase QueH [Bacteroides sp. 224]NDV66270.1 diacylglucosamine hydrolase [Bacteroides sp. 224]